MARQKLQAKLIKLEEQKTVKLEVVKKQKLVKQEEKMGRENVAKLMAGQKLQNKLVKLEVQLEEEKAARKE